MKYELRVAPTHRFAEVSIRTKRGKVWVGKDKVTSIPAGDLLPGEDEVIRRYEREGRLVAVLVEPETELAPKPPHEGAAAIAGRQSTKNQR